MRKHAIGSFLVLSIFLVSGCTSGGDTKISLELSKTIEDAINERYVYYLDITNIAYSENSLVIEYVSYEPTLESSIYSQMIKVMKETIFYVEQNNLKPLNMQFKVVDRNSKTYSTTLTYQEVKDFTDAKLDFNYWKSKTQIVGNS